MIVELGANDGLRGLPLDLAQRNLEAIVAKGFPVEEVVVQRERASVHTLLTPTLRAKVRGVADPLLGPLQDNGGPTKTMAPAA